MHDIIKNNEKIKSKNNQNKMRDIMRDIIENKKEIKR